jgi:hypothetical protein
VSAAKPGDDAGGSRLARAGFADQRQRAAAMQIEAHIVQHLVGVIGGIHILDLEHGVFPSVPARRFSAASMDRTDHRLLV